MTQCSSLFWGQFNTNGILSLLFILLNDFGFITDVVGKYKGTLKPGTALDDAGPDHLLAF